MIVKMRIALASMIEGPRPDIYSIIVISGVLLVIASV